MKKAGLGHAGDLKKSRLDAKRKEFVRSWGGNATLLHVSVWYRRNVKKRQIVRKQGGNKTFIHANVCLLAASFKKYVQN